MQFARVDFSPFKSAFSYIFREIPRRRACQCRFGNVQKPIAYNRHFAGNRARSRHKPLPPLYTTDASLFADGDEHNVDTSLGHYNVRNALHQESNDPITRRFNECASVDELFALLNERYEWLGPEHTSQCVLVLWDLQKSYNEAYLHNLGNSDVERSPEFMISKYLNKLHEHKDFHKLLRLLDVHCMDLTLSEVACCLLYLRKMGVAINEGVMERLLGRCAEAAGQGVTHSLVDLTRLTAAIEPKDSYRYLSIVCQLIPAVLQYLGGFKSPEEVRLITFLLYNVQLLVTEPILNRYKERLRHLILTGVLRRHHYPVLLKAASLLNLPHWSRQNFIDIRDICELVAPEIPNMDPASIITLHKMFQTHLEPAHMLEALSARTAQHVADMRHDERMSHHLVLPHLLFCCATYSPPHRRPALEKLTADYMSKIFPTTLIAFYKILRYIKTPNAQLCDNFWGKTIYFLVRDHGDDHLVLRFSHKYIYFSNVGNLYRNYYFERLMLDLLMKKFDEDYITLFPRKLSRLSAFLIAYGYSGNSLHVADMERVVLRVEAARDRFDPLDCLLLSRGLQICSVAMTRRHTSPVLAQLFHRVDQAITERTQSLGANGDISLTDLNCLVKCHINKKTHPNSDITYDLIKKYSTMKNREQQLTSQSIRDTAYNLTTCGVIIPSLFEEMASYLISNKGRLLGETVQKVLNLFYTLGYSPKRTGLFDMACEVTERDKGVMTSLLLLQMCRALSYYQQLPASLVSYVFSIQFMERLDEEVATCYKKWLYPRRVRRQLMELNRSVCVESPQHRVPWFHEKYLQELIANTGVRRSQLERGVVECVRSVWPAAEVTAPHYTPYGYKCNLLLTLGSDKVGIVLLDNADFCRLLVEGEGEGEGGYRAVSTGAARHRRRHLEMLGYRLLEVSAAEWNAMHMSEPNVKARFLRSKIEEIL